MKTIAMISVVIIALLVVGAIGVMAYNEAKVVPCSSCGGKCNAVTNCGSASCAAASGTGPCSCGNTASNK